jgi:flagellar hook assembly protein FlgD
VRFALPAPGEYRVEIFDAAGRRVRTHADRADRPGLHDWRWDGLDDVGRGVPAGAYFCRVSAGGVSSEERVIVVE